MDRALPIVALVGRPNVGKSTLFNRIVGRRAAIVEDLPGVTRDRHYAEADWDGRRFLAVDTGGFWVGESEPLLADVRKQAERAIAEASAIVLVVDARAGLTAADEEVARVLRRGGKPVVVALNKVDSAKTEVEIGSEFWRLGWKALHPISAEHGRGVGTLLDDVVAGLPRAESGAAAVPEIPRVAILGRPNVGKSTLVNRLLGEARFVESPVAGTTRDSIDAETVAAGRRYVLTDTAGIRRKGRAGGKLELVTIGRAIEALDRSDVAAVLVDATEPAVEQDSRVAGLCVERAKPMILVVNKADLLQGRAGRSKVEEAIAEQLPFLPERTPLLFVSAREGNGLDRLLPLAGRLFDQAAHRLPTPELNRFLREVETAHPAPRVGAGSVRLYYIAQVGIRPPTFLVHVNRPEGVGEPYRRFVASRLRERFGIEVPVRLVFRKRTRRGETGS